MKKSKRIVIGALSAVAAIIVVGALVWYSAYRRAQDLKVQASRAIVAWVFEGQPIPGFERVDYVPGVGERRYSWYAASDAMRKANRWYVVCDFLPQSVVLSDNSKIERISEEEALAILDQAITTREGSFLFIHFPPDRSERGSILRQKIRLNILTSYAVLGGDIYEFIFTLEDGQMHVTGRHAGGS